MLISMGAVGNLFFIAPNKAICALPFEERETGYQTLDILLQLLSDEDLKKIVEITYNEYINPSVEA